MSTFEDVFGQQIDADQPAYIENGELRPAQIAWVKNGVDVSVGNDGEDIADDEYLGGEGRLVTELGTSHQFTIDLDYEMASPAFGIRRDTRGDYETHYEFDIIIDGSFFARIPDGALSSSLSWFQEGNATFGSIGPGSVTVELDMDPERDGSGDPFIVDALGMVDDRWRSFDDNSLHEPGGHVDRPREYPDAVEILASEFTDIEGGIVAAGIDVNINDLSGSQALALSFDSGATFTEAANTDSIDADAEDAAPSVIGRVTLGSTDAVRNTASPREGFEPQVITNYQLRITEIDQVVFDETRYTGSYYDIAQQMHEDGGLVFNAIPDETQLLVESFQRGDVDGDPIEWTRQRAERVANTQEYANVLTVAGGRPDSDTEEEPPIPVVEVRNDDEINRIGEEVPDYITNEQLTTTTQLENFGAVQLRDRIRADEVSGTIEIVPQLLEPAKRYYVPAFGAESVLERQTFEDGPEPTCRLEFEDITDISTTVSGLRGDLKRR